MGFITALLGVVSGLFSWLSGKGQAARDAAQRKAGQDEIKVAVSEGALHKQVDAMKDKERTDAAIRDSDYHRNVDRL